MVVVMMMMRSVIILMQTGFCWLSSTDAFVTRHLTGTQWSHSSIRQYSFFQEWESISRGDRGVWKQTMVKGTSDRTIPKNSTFEIKYKGFLVGEYWWTPRDVIGCWMSELQGMEQFCAAIAAENVDGSQLLDPDIFTETFVQEKLGIMGKLQCKKLVMAAKRLQKVREDFPVGHVFDCNDHFSVTPTKRIIRGIRIGVESMNVGDKAKIVCRSDYGYGAEGLRRNNGETLVPPFATLCFEISLLDAFVA